MEDLIRQDLEQAREEFERFLNDPDTVGNIASAADIFIDALKRGNKIIACGNGGSLCDATHFAEELTGRYRGNRRSLPAIAINDPAYITCTGNDFSFADIFSRYVDGLGCSGDVLLVISTSGTSADIVKAAEAARTKGMKTVILTGAVPGRLNTLADAAICAPRAPHSDRVQEIHIKVIHILIHAIEQGMGL